MTDPGTPNTPVLSISTDAPSYAPGAPVTLTCSYSDSQTETLSVTVTATGTAQDGGSVTSSTGFSVVTTAPEHVDITVSDDHSGTWVLASDDGVGTAVFTSTAPAS